MVFFRFCLGCLRHDNFRVCVFFVRKLTVMIIYQFVTFVLYRVKVMRLADVKDHGMGG